MLYIEFVRRQRGLSQIQLGVATRIPQTFPKEQPRHFIIVGTTNAMSGYLKDVTGARRFWPVHVERFDIERKRHGSCVREESAGCREDE